MAQRKCSVCMHPKRAQIAEAILAGETLEAMAEHYKLSIAALSRHRSNHTLADSMPKRRPPKRPRRKNDDQQQVNAQEAIRKLLRDLEDLRDQEQEAGRSTAVAQISDKILRALELQSKMGGTFGKERADKDDTRVKAFAEGIRGMSKENLDAMISGYSCNHCGSRVWFKLREAPWSWWLDSEAPCPTHDDLHRFTEAQQTVVNNRPYWLVPAFRSEEDFQAREERIARSNSTIK